ncbi:LOW QUALITY PROTEIN: interferon-induced protein with tetratricopeptide repeats 1B-like [Lemur catta]|uniref:LOW QUALITY PROTEIN: interferon-induced protein with tetratricopeptide repeats 1B-like n=1 Tax=Lemur catta TaxID=9447 RepID=UPI001E269C09|nr:LOW QUALITY PROTEIN: interferon-induced protein with tetratricopeptide repeats 1B-like [Lemur catta]
MPISSQFALGSPSNPISALLANGYKRLVRTGKLQKIFSAQKHSDIHLDGFKSAVKGHEGFSLHPLRKAVRLNPDDTYVKVLLALKLQDEGQEAEGEKYIKEAPLTLDNMTSPTYVFRYAAKFYRRRGSPDRALQLLKMALQATPTSAFLHHQIGLCHRAQMMQIKTATNMQPTGQDREKVDRFVQLAIHEFEKTLTLKPTFELAYVDLAEVYAERGHHKKAEDAFQKALHVTIIDDYIQQQIHYCYGHFQEHHRKSEDKAITHCYLQKIEKMSYAREKILSALEKLAKRCIDRNVHVVESFILLGPVHKLKGEVSDPLLCYERALRLAADLNPML